MIRHKGYLFLFLALLSGCGHCWQPVCRNNSLLATSLVPGSVVARDNEKLHSIAIVQINGVWGYLYVPKIRVWFREGLPEGFAVNQIFTFDEYLALWQVQDWR